ncbi:hypothetical protein ACFYUL_33365 [Streptomyces sp. NPDC004311]|uniref:hypothetical protein n=1 Tax=Streptomyces sp. NPDC004311 TaxID=3364698 RepID=UPI0036CB26AB
MSHPAPRMPQVPQPPVQAEAIRAALSQLAPHLLPDFDRDRAASTERARSEVSAIPLRAFSAAWAIEVAIVRHPETAERLHDLQIRLEQVSDLDEARKLTAEISRIRREAAAEAGVPTVGPAAW